MTSLVTGDYRTLHIDEIKPYWRNPRRVPEEAVNALVESISRYGYSQPIVVDEENIIIIGHTRYAALRKMRVEQVPVLVTDDLTVAQVKQLRVIDNRVAEFTSWDFESLKVELDGLDEGLRLQFFPDVSIDGLVAASKAAETAEPNVVPEVDFVCPSCFHSFEIKVTKPALYAGVLRVEEEEATA